MSRLQLQRKYTVIKDHVRTYNDPISVSIGEKVQVGGRDTDWPSWLWCTNSQQKSGWVAERVLDLHDDGTATVRQDYNSIELTVVSGEKVTGFEQFEGWMWCHNENHEAGWIPLSHVIVEES
jgi:hypothetical protein